MALYRDQRPRTFDDVIGQDALVGAFRTALRKEQLGHALLLSGQRGTGKTTLARILAKSLNCDQAPTDSPCLTCESCVSIDEDRSPDVFEMDAASNRGVDDARALRERLSVTPVGRNNIIIIDEAHMLTREAQNALLKSVEEPPKNVYFFFATTEKEKLLKTIRSRCQQFAVRRASVDDLVVALRRAADAAGITVQDDDALAMLAADADGAYRDALSRLEQFRGSGVLTSDAITALVGRPAEQQLIGLLGHVAGRDTAAVLGAAQELVAAGCDLSVTLESLAQLLRGVMYARELGEVPAALGASARTQEAACEFAQVMDLERIYQLLTGVDNARQQMTRGVSPEIAFEFALLSGLVDPAPAAPAPQAVAVPKPATAPKSGSTVNPETEAKPVPPQEPQPSPDESSAPQSEPIPLGPCTLTAAQLSAAFPAVRLSLRSTAPDLYLQIITSKATAEDGVVTVHVPAELPAEHEKKLKDTMRQFGEHDVQVAVTAPPRQEPEASKEPVPVPETSEVAAPAEEKDAVAVADAPPATDDDLDALLLNEGAVLED